MAFGYIPASTGLLANNESALTKAAGSYFNRLNELGGQRLSLGQINDPNPLFYFLITGGTENIILELREIRKKTAPNEPVFLLAHPYFNSLPACLEVLARLQQDGIPGKILYLKDADDEEAFDKLTDLLHDLEVMQKMKTTRIGLIGSPSDWLTASSPTADQVKHSWGPEVVYMSFGQLKDRIENLRNNGTASYKSSLEKNSVAVKEPAQTEIETAAKVYVALRQLVENNRLDSITVRCFDLVTDMKTTGCFGLSQLTDEGIIAGCEGDLCSTIGMLWANLLLGETPWMANPAQLDEKKNRLWLAHCTVPRKMVKDYSLRSHFESGLGVGIQGTLPDGPVTLLRVGGRKLDQIWLSEGSILRAGYSENLCRTQAEIELTSGGKVSDLLNAPLGNHLVMVYGHHMQRLKAWWDMFIKIQSQATKSQMPELNR